MDSYPLYYFIDLSGKFGNYLMVLMTHFVFFLMQKKNFCNGKFLNPAEKKFLLLVMFYLMQKIIFCIK